MAHKLLDKLQQDKLHVSSVTIKSMPG